jgi:hypothetical protein
MDVEIIYTDYKTKSACFKSSESRNGDSDRLFHTAERPLYGGMVEGKH